MSCRGKRCRRMLMSAEARANGVGEVLTEDIAKALDSLVGRMSERVMLNSPRHCLLV